MKRLLLLPLLLATLHAESLFDGKSLDGWEIRKGEEQWWRVEDGWNSYRIRCEGPRVRLWLNGILTVDYEEQDPEIPRTGLIALQTHSGAPFEVRYRRIHIVELP
ncbi:DUF1080 domain-containing protein [Haloferula sp. A504]|uniref:DUF1080 domain-containing protein n=1 Tax=Haloferula sp. A504 TaxID=3373601 RepID=UPI0031BE32BD|nr:DUF1080 domain-containing protein [Verrucomicrobiaceae bacterium E54]